MSNLKCTHSNKCQGLHVGFRQLIEKVQNWEIPGLLAVLINIWMSAPSFGDIWFIYGCEI